MDAYANRLTIFLSSFEESQTVPSKRKRVEKYTDPRSLPRLSEPAKRSEPVHSLIRGVEEDPWQKYSRLLEEDQAGKVVIAYSKTLRSPLLAVKRITWTERVPERITRPSSTNTVELYEVLRHEDNLYFVNECMAVSLAQIAVSPRGKLREQELAAICEPV